MASCVKCGGKLTRTRNCTHCGPNPPTRVTKLPDLINLYRKQGGDPAREKGIR